ncbi:hypothetical protein BRC71_00905 [Halobacteriales archaeon QH_7_65_31]|nr:MAG: hypothetical protein BRC71_00905 [Halobacteriales archaeon QH_7_65_31]
MTDDAPDPEHVRAKVRRATGEYERVREAVESGGGEAAIRETTGAYRRFRQLLAENEESATGSGFQAYIEFQEAVASATEELDESMPAYEAFEAADDSLHVNRLSASDFEKAREALDPAREYADLLVEWEAAEELLRETRRAARDRLATLDEEIETATRLLDLGEADLDAPVERLREPIERYNERAFADFDRLMREASARELFGVVESADSYPLVDFRDPPTRLREYIESDAAGEESVKTLLKYADYSAEKLGHYVENPGDLSRFVATNQTYLANLDASPLTVPYPPPEAGELEYECKERIAVCNRFADETTLAALREVRSLPNETDYERLRESALALTELEERERERLQAGEVEPRRRQHRAERDALAEALDATPES